MDVLNNIRTKTEHETFKTNEVDPYLSSPEYAAYQAQQLQEQQNACCSHLCKVLCAKIQTPEDTDDACKRAFTNLPFTVVINGTSETDRNTIKSDLESKGYTVTFDANFYRMTVS